jgi:hypothetical protein
MTLRLSERYVTALNLLLIAILAYFLALSVNDIVLGRVADASAHLPSLVGPEPSAPVAHPRGYYNGIARRDIFNLVPVTEAPAEVATNLHIKLIGTSMLTLSQPFIIVEDDNSHEQSLYRMGDEIPDAGKLVGVHKDHAIVLHQGRRTKLEMPTDENGNGEQPPPFYRPSPFGLPRRGFGGFFARPLRHEWSTPDRSQSLRARSLDTQQQPEQHGRAFHSGSRDPQPGRGRTFQRL